MEITILRILKLKVRDGGRLAMRGHTDQMMPAQYLMENDPIRKPAEPQAENEAGPNQWLRPDQHIFEDRSVIRHTP